MGEKFRDEKSKVEAEETKRNHAFQSLIQDLGNSIATAKDDIKAKTDRKLANSQDSIDANAKLDDTKSTLEDDQVYLKGLVATCTSKADDHEARQKLRAEEIQAIEKAVEIISSEAVKGNDEKHLHTALLSKAKGVFAQLRSSSKEPDSALALAADKLADAATRLNIQSLAVLAMHARKDPLAKVKRLIEELITRLIAEAGAEAEHKGWCDTELGQNEHTRKRKTAEFDNLRASIDELSADLATLTKDLETLAAEEAQLKKDVEKETDLRNNETAQNNKTIAEAKQGEDAVGKALTVLNEFYAKAAKAKAFVQDQPTPPESPDEPYTGMQSESGGVIGMLEVIQSDFARLYHDTLQAEETAQQEFQSFMEASRIDEAQRDKDIEHKSAEKNEKTEKVTKDKEDLEDAENALKLAQEAFDKLKPVCIDTGMSYEERKERREQEIESLKDALDILENYKAA